jgi:malonyl-CoA decarboxylase
MPQAVAPLLDRKVLPDADKRHYKVAAFYSISNCQPGLRGVSLGNFLIKRVAETLKEEFSGLKSFCTLSPIPSFASFVLGQEALARDSFTPRRYAQLQALRDGVREELRVRSGGLNQELLDQLQRLCAAYLFQTSSQEAHPSDPVARFHLNNGARLERINLNADLSAKGLKQSFGMMVNYAYDLDDIEANHEKFVAGQVTASRPVRGLID